MSTSMGLFKTPQVQEDGSIIYIMHNKSDLKSSNIQWKMTADGVAVSSDYGKTWNAGIDKNGNATFNVMSAVGILFDWAKGGTLTLGGVKNKSGVAQILDENGNLMTTLDKDGIVTNGKYVCGSDEFGRRAEISEGEVKIRNANGDIIGEVYAGSDNWFFIKAGDVQIRILKNTGEVYIDATKFGVNGYAGKSGTIYYSDGTYAEYKNGILIGGKSKDGEF